MSTNFVDSLLSKIDDESLRIQLANEFNKLRDNKEFGLVFERHIPEYVRLYKRKITEGAHVQLKSSKSDNIFTVREIKGKKVKIGDKDDKISLKKLDELVVVIRHGDSIYPGLVEVDRVDRGGDKPFHTVINSENYHALQLLRYVYNQKIDCIYIDPPYNSGATDWKYNNDYVDAEDRYRHSKWLSFIEKRLLIAKDLLNRDDSVLIVTIDEKEVHRLRSLIEQNFPGRPIQIITTVISQNGTSRDGEFSRVEEFILIARLGRAKILRINDNMLSSEGKGKISRIWFNFMRTSTLRTSTNSQFYPIFINPKTKQILEIGEPIKRDQPIPKYELSESRIAIFPIRDDDLEATWGAIPTTARELLKGGFLRLGSLSKKTGYWSIQYVREGDRNRYDAGSIISTGTESDGSLKLQHVDVSNRLVYPKTVWNRISHDATVYGTRLNKALIPGRNFSYPKSLYAVEDVIRFFVKDKPNAKILDFFGGSGTTCHATMRLNKQDNGRRVSIVVTNNEISKEEADEFRKKGVSRGDDEWEKLGIFQYITMPRISAAVTGLTHDGTKIKGAYKFRDEFPISDGLEENVMFLALDYLEEDSTRRNNEFGKISSILWMISGSLGSVISSVSNSYSLQAEGNYGILFNTDYWQEFVNEVKQIDTITHAFIITDSKVQYQQVVKHLPTNIETTMLYEDYLRNFQIGV